MSIQDYFSGKRWQRRLGYLKARLLGRTRTWGDLEAFARHVVDYKWIDGATGRDITYPEKLFKVMTEVEGYAYKGDEPPDQWRHPLAFMFGKLGDCEDWSAFMAECLAIMGYEPLLAVVYYSGQAHCVCVFEEVGLGMMSDMPYHWRACSNWGTSVTYPTIRLLVTDMGNFPGFERAEILNLNLSIREEIIK